MVHVQIKKTLGGTGGAATSVIVDGVEMSKMIMADGFHIELNDYTRYAEVSMVLGADVLDIDLPDAVVKVIRSTDDATRRDGGKSA